jgi:hypothetical protein
MTQILSPAPRLDSAESLVERCDQCGVAAKLRVDLSGGGTLAFCGHHANQHAVEISRLARQIVVEDGFHWRGRAARS